MRRLARQLRAAPLRGRGLIVPLVLALVVTAEPAALAKSSYDHGPAGTVVLHALLRDLGYNVRRVFDVRALADKQTRAAVVVGMPRPRRVKALLRWAKQGHVLIVAPPLAYCVDVELDKLKLDRVRGRRKMRARDDAKLAVRDAGCLVKTPKTGRVLVGKRDGALVFEHAVGRGTMLVLAHADLLDNANLGRDDTIVVLRRWLATQIEAGAAVAFFEEPRAGQIWRAARQAGLVPLLAHVLVFLLMLYWVVTPRFGETISAEPSRRREFSQHAKALGHLYLGASASPYALRQQYERFRTSPAGRGGAAQVATRSGRDREEIEQLFEQIEAAITSDKAADSKQVQRHFRLSQMLAELHGSVSGGTRPSGDRARTNRGSE